MMTLFDVAEELSRRLAAASMPDVTTAREARGVTEPQSPA
jgi:hypothetical protein